MEIVKTVENDIEFYTIEATGESGMSQSGLALLVGVTPQSLSKLEQTLSSNNIASDWLRPFQKKESRRIEINKDSTINGKQIGNLIIYKAHYCAAVISHYIDKSDRPEVRRTALQNQQKFSAIGIENWIQRITGWKDRYSKLHTDVYINRLRNMNDHKVPDDCWSVFEQGSTLLLKLEMDWKVPVVDYDLLDGSIGNHWVQFRENKKWVGKVSFYPHVFRDQRGEIQAKCYELKELPHFKKWLREEYEPIHLPEYLKNKYGKKSTRTIYTEVGALTPRILELTEIKKETDKQNRLYEEFLLLREQLVYRQTLKG